MTNEQIKRLKNRKVEMFLSDIKRECEGQRNSDKMRETTKQNRKKNTERTDQQYPQHRGKKGD